MLLTKGKITQDIIALLDKWRHTGFNVYAGPRILPRYENAMENLARYIIRASFSQERMTYHRETGHVAYQSKDGYEEVIRKILKHLNLWDGKQKLPPRAHAPPMDYPITHDDSQMPDVDDQVTDIKYPVEAYFNKIIVPA